MAGSRRNNNIYVEGNAARKLQEVPEIPRHPVRRQEREEEAVPPKQVRRGDSRVRKNQEKALNMNKGFLGFLVLVSLAILLVAVQYLQLKSEITASSKTIASLESEYSALKEDNDAYYSQVSSDIDLERIRKIAVGRLGMRAPSQDQTRTYQTSRGSYIRQYQDIPDTE